MLLLLLFEWILQDYKREVHGCGIPVIWWIQVLFVIQYGRVLIDLNLLWIVRIRRNWALWFRLLTFFLQQFLSATWTIYGMNLYFSDKNDCQEYPDSQTALIWMVIFMFFGFLALLFMLLLAIILPLAYFYLRNHQPAADVQGDQISQVISRLQQSSYNPMAQEDTMCQICMEDYKTEDMVTTLKCSTKHMFHSKCIIEWIQNGHNTCPMCRAQIENVEDVRE